MKSSPRQQSRRSDIIVTSGQEKEEKKRITLLQQFEGHHAAKIQKPRLRFKSLEGFNFLARLLFSAGALCVIHHHTAPYFTRSIVFTSLNLSVMMR